MVLEALASGVLVITSSPVFSAAEKAGCLMRFCENDDEDLAAVIEKAQTSGMLGRSSLRIDYVREHHDLDKLIGRITDFFSLPAETAELNADLVAKKYNSLVGATLQGAYEENRWFRDPIQRAAYDMTRRSVERQALTVPFTRYFELGPGPGTWTKLFVAREPEASFTLVDISEEMIRAAQRALPPDARVTCLVRDFSEFATPQTYDLFFSSRAFEYLPDKAAAVKKIMALLAPGGRGFIITKTPKYWRDRLRGRNPSAFHRGQISPRRFRRLLRKCGARDVALYPVTVSVPWFNSPRLNLFVCRLLCRWRLNPFSQAVAESYGVRFKKP